MILIQNLRKKFVQRFVWWRQSQSTQRQTQNTLPLFAPVPCLPAPSTGYKFSHVWHRLYVIPRLKLVTFCLIHVNPHLVLLGTHFSSLRFLRYTGVFPRLAPVSLPRFTQLHNCPHVQFLLIYYHDYTWEEGRQLKYQEPTKIVICTRNAPFTWCILQPNLLPQRLVRTWAAACCKHNHYPC